MGSLEDLDIDVTVAMENFERSESDECFIGDNEVQGVSRQNFVRVQADQIWERSEGCIAAFCKPQLADSIMTPCNKREDYDYRKYEKVEEEEGGVRKG